MEPGADGDLIRKYLVGVLGVRVKQPSRLEHQILKLAGVVPADSVAPPLRGHRQLRMHLFRARANQDAL